MTQLTPFISAETLQQNFSDTVIVDVSDKNAFTESHLIGARNIPYGHFVMPEPPVMGLAPQFEDLNEVLGLAGLSRSDHIVVYDRDGGGKSGRFYWTLDLLGHENKSVLDGGLAAWQHAGGEVTSEKTTFNPTNYQGSWNEDVIADKAFILNNLLNRNVKIVDVRTPAEYSGEDNRALFGGHIPRAVNLDWILTMNLDADRTLKPENEIRALLNERHIHPEQDVVVHCHTHHRSGHTYVLLKHLGYRNVRGYPGSWSEWGNSDDVPIA